ncbi:MAG: hypothetical protein KJP07_02355 [Desulfatitalea sp.]|nr:hypothetical protein [Desulfatitalea sp.]
MKGSNSSNILKKITHFSFFLSFIAGFAVPSMASNPITAAVQPANGPGSAIYEYDFVRSPIMVGSGMQAADIYEPLDAAGDELPVIVFVHGYLPQNPVETIAAYTEFIEHLVKKGYIVITPYYQNAITLGFRFTPNCAAGIRNALAELNDSTRWITHPRPKYLNDILQFGMIGHSMGGIMAGNIAAKYTQYEVPRPLAIMAMNQESSLIVAREWEENGGLLFDEDTNVLVVVGVDDNIAFKKSSNSFWSACANICSSRKDWILMNTDTHADPDSNDLVAHHFAPTNVSRRIIAPELNNFDYWGYWKWATALMNYTFYQTHGSFAFGDTNDQRDLGTWSDGISVIDPNISDSPYWGP